MFDRNGSFIRYTTEEEMMAVLTGDRLDPSLDAIFRQAMVVDAASHGWNDALKLMLNDMGDRYSPHDHDHRTTRRSGTPR